MNSRYTFETRKYSLRARLGIYFRKLWRQVLTPPPKDYSIEIEIHPGDAEYDEAPFEMGMAQSPVWFEREIPK